MNKLFNSSRRHFLSKGVGIGKLNHVAIATPDLGKTGSFYKNVLGADVSDKVQDEPNHGVSVLFVNLDNSKIELIHPLGENSPISNFLEKNQNGGIHHVCFEVKDIKAAVKNFEENNIRVLNEPKLGAHNKLVVFLHPKDTNGVLIEIEEV